MPNVHWIVPLLLFLFSIAGFVGAALWVGEYTYPHIKNQKDCDTKSRELNQKDKHKCANWDDGAKMCRKGDYDASSGKCKSAGHVGPLIIAIISVLLLIGGIVTLVMVIRNRHKSGYAQISPPTPKESEMAFC
jgi:hypothetical protein